MGKLTLYFYGNMIAEFWALGELQHFTTHYYDTHDVSLHFIAIRKRSTEVMT